MEKEEQIKILKSEIAMMYRIRKILLINAFIALGVGINIALILSVYGPFNYVLRAVLIFMAAESFLAFPILMIIRSAAFNHPISNRKRLLKDLESEE